MTLPKTNIWIPSQISVSNNGHVWGIDEKMRIWYRKGANSKSILGTTWKSISGKLKQVSESVG